MAIPAEYKLLISGTSSGLGHALHGTLGGIGLARDTPLDEARIRAARTFDAVIHCAFNATKTITMHNGFGYLSDNFLLTQKLLTIPHKKFIYISSIGVYPRRNKPIAEHEDVDVSTLAGPYAVAKLFSDLLVQYTSANYLILRPTTMLGPAMRLNTTKRILTERNCDIFLAKASRFNYVLHEDIVAFIRLALQRDLTGVYNIASEGSVLLRSVVKQLGLSVHTGSFQYDVGSIDNSRAASVLPVFARPSWQTLNRYIDSLGSAFVGTGRLNGLVGAKTGYSENLDAIRRRGPRIIG